MLLHGQTLSCVVVQDQLNSVARFLDARGHTTNALEVATDPDYKFELAVQLGRLDTALEIAETADSEGKWRQLSELAMSSGKLQVLNHSPTLPEIKLLPDCQVLAVPGCEPFVKTASSVNAPMFERLTHCKLAIHRPSDC